MTIDDRQEQGFPMTIDRPSLDPARAANIAIAGDAAGRRAACIKAPDARS